MRDWLIFRKHNEGRIFIALSQQRSCHSIGDSSGFRTMTWQHMRAYQQHPLQLTFPAKASSLWRTSPCLCLFNPLQDVYKGKWDAPNTTTSTFASIVMMGQMVRTTTVRKRVGWTSRRDPRILDTRQGTKSIRSIPVTCISSTLSPSLTID